MDGALPAWDTRPLVAPLLGGLLIAAGLLYVLRLDSFQIGAWQDDAYYIVSARAMAAGQGYALASFPDTPPARVYPPGYPLLLTTLAALAPDALALYRVPSLLLSLASLALWFVLLRRRLALGPALLVLGAAATNTLTVQFATMVMSEALFAFLLAVLFLLLDVDLRQKRLASSRALAVGLVLGALYLTRAIGIAFVPAVLAYVLVARQVRSALLILAVFLVPFIAWGYRNATVSDGHLVSLVSPGYEHQLGEQIATASAQGVSRPRLVTMNIQYYTSDLIPDAFGLSLSSPRISAALNRVGLEWLQSAIGITLVVLLLLGFRHRLALRPIFAEVSLIFYAGALLLWPGPVTRLLHPVVPLLYLLLFEGIRDIGSKVSGVQRPRVSSATGATVVLVALIAVNLGRDIQGLVDPVRNRITDLRVGSEWLAANTPADSIIMAEAPVSRHLYSRRLMVDLPSAPATAACTIVEHVRGSGAHYVLIAPPLQTPRTLALTPAAERLDRALAARPERFRLVFTAPHENVRIYEVLSVRNER